MQSHFNGNSNFKYSSHLNYYGCIKKIICSEATKYLHASMQEHQNPNGSRITIAQARKALGMIARNYSDEEIVDMLACMREAAEFTYEKFSRTGDE